MGCQNRRKGRDPSSSRCCWAGSGKATGKRWNNCFRWSIASCTGWRGPRYGAIGTSHPAAHRTAQRSVPALFGRQLPEFSDRAHFLGVAGRVMRQVLVDHARTQGALKRGPALQVELPENLASNAPAGSLLELDQALERLAQEDPRLVTLIEMRFFAGMTAEETAESTRESVHVVRHDLRYAQARLRRLMVGPGH